MTGWGEGGDIVLPLRWHGGRRRATGDRSTAAERRNFCQLLHRIPGLTRLAASPNPSCPVKLTLTAFVYTDCLGNIIGDAREGLDAEWGSHFLFQRHEPIAGMSGNMAALAMSQAISLGRADVNAEAGPSWREWLAQIDLVPDLGDHIGSAIWWRGLAT